MKSIEELTKLKCKEILIKPKLSLKIKEQTLFKADGGEGLHLWEASIVLSRYSLKHSQYFQNRKIIELGCGCGLLGISILKEIQVEKYSFSDYNSSVLNNLKDNLKLNGISLNDKNIEIKQDDWKDYEKMTSNEYDVILGTELIYKGGAILELAKVISRILKPDGKCFISMPKERSMTKTFLDYCENEGLKWKSLAFNEINDEDEKKYLFSPALKNDKQKIFEDLSKMNIMLYEINK